jgi:hypothetical protein
LLDNCIGEYVKKPYLFFALVVAILTGSIASQYVFRQGVGSTAKTTDRAVAGRSSLALPHQAAVNSPSLLFSQQRNSNRKEVTMNFTDVDLTPFLNNPGKLKHLINSGLQGNMDAVREAYAALQMCNSLTNENEPSAQTPRGEARILTRQECVKLLFGKTQTDNELRWTELELLDRLATNGDLDAMSQYMLTFSRIRYDSREMTAEIQQKLTTYSEIALKHMSKASADGSVFASSHLAELYLLGEVVPKNKAIALTFAQKAVSQGADPKLLDLIN